MPTDIGCHLSRRRWRFTRRRRGVVRNWEGYPLSSRLWGLGPLGSVVSSPSGVEPQPKMISVLSKRDTMPPLQCLLIIFLFGKCFLSDRQKQLIQLIRRVTHGLGLGKVKKCYRHRHLRGGDDDDRYTADQLLCINCDETLSKFMYMRRDEHLQQRRLQQVNSEQCSKIVINTTFIDGSSTNHRSCRPLCCRCSTNCSSPWS